MYIPLKSGVENTALGSFEIDFDFHLPSLGAI